MKLTKETLKRIIKEELEATLNEGPIGDSGFKIGDKVKYDAIGGPAGEIIDIEGDGVDYHGHQDTSPTANKRTLLTIQFADGKTKKVASHHMISVDQEPTRM
tara:strand:- start:219 stop:524 length:306 start_codon:yes stop_codon:yes gene_type:complete